MAVIERRLFPATAARREDDPPVSGTPGSLVKLDRISVWVLDLDLAPPRADLDLVPEAHAGLPQRLDVRIEIVDVEEESVPAAGLLLPPVGQRAGAGAARAAQD